MLLLAGCTAAPNPVAEFHAQMQTFCGQTITGEVISTNEADADWRSKVLTVGPITCVDDNTTRMALAVGSDQSRVWTLSHDPAAGTLRLNHDHTLKDGSPDPVTGYGGVASAATGSTATHAVFPVDQISKDVFSENGLTASMTNTWTLTLEPGETLTYALSRENRDFRAQFNLRGD